MLGKSAIRCVFQDRGTLTLVTQNQKDCQDIRGKGTYEGGRYLSRSNAGSGSRERLRGNARVACAPHEGLVRRVGAQQARLARGGMTSNKLPYRTLKYDVL